MWTYPENDDKATHIYSVKDNSTLAVLPTGERVFATRFSQDDRTLAVATKDSLIIWKHIRMPGVMGWMELPFFWLALFFFVALMFLAGQKEVTRRGDLETPAPEYWLRTGTILELERFGETEACAEVRKLRDSRCREGRDNRKNLKLEGKQQARNSPQGRLPTPAEQSET